MRKAVSLVVWLMAVACANFATAAPITWQSPVTVSANTDVMVPVPPGSIVQAYNVGDSNVPATTTVNGVAFTGVDTSNSTNNSPPLAPNNVYTVNFGNDSIANIESNYNGAIYPGFQPTSPTLSTNYNAILAGSTFNDAGALTLTLGGLNSGQPYTIEFWVSDGRTGFSRQETLTAGNTSTNLNFGGSNGTAQAQYITGTFFASGTSEVITVNSPQSAQINAFTLATPNPDIRTIGDTAAATTSNASLDSYYGSTYADAIQTFQTAGKATSVSFNSGVSGNYIQFMVGTWNSAHTSFTPTGIFNPIMVASGYQTVNLTTLGLYAGSASVTAGETFGWTDQNIATASYNQGSILYSGAGSAVDFYGGFYQQPNGSPPYQTPAIGVAVSPITFGPRDYAVNFTVTTVPEPASIVLTGLGALERFQFMCSGIRNV